jgi:hypothetical protein
MPAKPDERLWSRLQFPFGFADAIDELGTNAAPLLAGFAFALIGLTVDKRDALGEADLALLLLVIAGIALVSAVQLNFIARSFHFSPGEYFDLRKLAEEDGVGAEAVKDMARSYLIKHRRWATRSRLSYNIGVMVLFFGVAATLVPAAGIWHMAPLRAAAVCLVSAAGLVEAALLARETLERLAPSLSRFDDW